MKHKWLKEHDLTADFTTYVCQICGLSLRVSGQYLLEKGEPDSDCPGEFKPRMCNEWELDIIKEVDTTT